MHVPLHTFAGVSSAPDYLKAQGSLVRCENFIPASDGRLTRRRGATLVHSRVTGFVGELRTADFRVGQEEHLLVYKFGQVASGSASTPYSPIGLACINKDTGAGLTVAGSVPFAVNFDGYSGVAQFGDYLLLGSPGLPFSVNDTAEVPAAPVVRVREGQLGCTYTITAPALSGGFITVTHTTLAGEYDGTLDISGIPLFTADPTSGTDYEKEPVYAVPISTGGTGLAMHQVTWGAWYTSGLTVYVNPALPWTNTYPAMPTAAGEYAFNPAYPTAVTFHSPTVNGTAGLVIAYHHTKVIQHPAYAKRVQEAQAEFDNKALAHTAAAAAGVRRTAIAAALGAALTSAGVANGVNGDYIVLYGMSTGIPVVVSDTGSSTGLSVVGRANPAVLVEDLPARHIVGGVVSIGAGEFAMKATSTSVAGTFGLVTWEECRPAGQQTHWTGGVAFGFVQGTTLYIATSSAQMQTLTGVPHPALERLAAEINPTVLYFLNGKFARTLHVMHERLVLGVNDTVVLSTAGDPLRFDSLSVSTVAASDAFALRAQGMDGDYLWGATSFMGGLVFYGQGQYLLSGRTPITSTGTTLLRLGSAPVDEGVPPCAVGADGLVSVHLLESGAFQLGRLVPGQFADSMREREILPQFRERGVRPVGLVSLPRGEIVLAEPTGLWVFTPRGEQYAPWRITYPGATIKAVSVYKGELDVVVHAPGLQVWRQHLNSGDTVADPRGVAKATAVFPTVFELDFAGRPRTGGTTILQKMELALDASSSVKVTTPGAYSYTLTPDEFVNVGDGEHTLAILEDTGRITVETINDRPVTVVAVAAQVKFHKG